jgi:N-formylglutamate amidohydrolase
LSRKHDEEAVVRGGDQVPLAVLHVPHSSRAVPKEIRPAITLSDQELEIELLRMTDHYTDELFRLESSVACSIVFPVSRLVVDPERFLDDSEEPMAERGMGVVYTRTSDGRALRSVPTQAERTELIERFYHPHHAQLEAAVAASLQFWQSCLVIDCHSFPGSPLRHESDQSLDRPDICIGTDTFHTPKWLRDEARHLFEMSGFRVATNRPFAGALVPASRYRRTERVFALMVEVNRSLYMEEISGQRRSNFEIQAERIQAVLRSLIEEFRKRVLAEPKFA